MLNKYILVLFMFSSFIKAADIEQAQSETINAEVVDNSQNLDPRINELDFELEKLKTAQKKLSSKISRDITFQNEIRKSSKDIIKLINTKQSDPESLRIELIQPVNPYIYVLPLVTIFIVIGSAIISLKTIKIKSQESLDALRNSNENQIIINQNNHNAERLRAQEEILSNSRQKWINDLREALSLLISILTQHIPVSNEERQKLFPLIWNEYYKIQLLLNPKEDLHNLLLSEIQDIISLCKPNYSASASSTDHFLSKRTDVLAISKKILKIEWDRVKSFE
jgi:seryl-tRNA synthetase